MIHYRAQTTESGKLWRIVADADGVTVDTGLFFDVRHQEIALDMAAALNMARRKRLGLHDSPPPSPPTDNPSRAGGA